MDVEQELALRIIRIIAVVLTVVVVSSVSSCAYQRALVLGAEDPEGAACALDVIQDGYTNAPLCILRAAR